jgi:ribonuclease-3
MVTPRQTPSTSHDRLGHAFVRPELLERALTHPSWVSENGGEEYERLEFLGDAVIGLVVSEYLHESRPDSAEGELSRAKSSLVRTASLADAARELDLGAMARFGRGALASGDRERLSVLEALYESVTAAIFLDGGLEAARSFVSRTLLADGMPGEHTHPPAADPKSRLQEETQAAGLGQPAYRIVSEDGPPHARAFTATVDVDGCPTVSGSGHTKQAAQQAAAAAALACLPRLKRRPRTR